MAYIRTAFTENGTFVANAMKVTAAPRLTATFDTPTQAVLLDLAQTGVTAGTYNNLAVDAFGRVTTGSFAPYLLTNQTINVSGDAVGSGGTAIALTLASTGVAAGTYSFATVAVDAKGRVTVASSGSIPASNIAFSGDASGSGATGGTIALTLANSGVAAGTYQLATVTVDGTGRVTAAASGSIAPQPIAFAGDATGAGLTGGTVALTLTSVGTPGSYNSVTTDARGRVVAGTLLPYLLANQSIALIGDATGNGATSIVVSLAASGVVAGSYDFASVVVDAKGRVTVASAGAPVTSVALAAGNGVTIAGSPITSVGTLTVGLAASGVVAGTYAFSTTGVDQFGRVVSVTAGTPVTSVALALPSIFTVTGAPVTSVGTLSGALATQAGNLVFASDAAGGTAAPAFRALAVADLPNSGAVAGNYSLPTVTVDAKGRVTAVASAAIASLGTSAPIVVQSAGTLGFKSIRAGSNITVTESANEVTIAAAASGPQVYSFRVALTNTGGAVDVATAGGPITNLPAGWTVTGTTSAVITINVGGAIGTMPSMPIVTTAGLTTTGVYAVRTVGHGGAIGLTITPDGQTMVMSGISGSAHLGQAGSNNHMWVRVAV